MKKDLLLKLAALSSAMLFCQTASAQSLQDAVQNTIQTNPSLLVTTTDRQAIGQELRQAKAGYLPKLDLTAGYGRERVTSPSVGTLPTGGAATATLNRGEAGLALEQMLFDGFATSSEVDRNKARVKSAIYRIRGSAEDLSLRVAEVYLGVLQRQEIVKMARENLAQHEQLYRMIDRRTQTGISNKADLVQASGRLELAKSTLRAAEGNLRDAETNYLEVVGSLPKNIKHPALPMSLPKTEATAVQLALENNPQLKLAEADLAAAQAQRQAAKSTNMPRVDLQLNANQDHNIGGIQGPNNDYAAMVRMKYNLFNGGADEARQRQTAYLVQEATEIKNRTWREVERSARLSWNSLTTSRSQLDFLKKHQDDASQTTQLYRKQFELSQRTLLDVLDSQTEFFNARKEFLDAQYLFCFAQFRVLNSMGKLVETLKVALPTDANLPTS